jgi:hypothetical protein
MKGVVFSELVEWIEQSHGVELIDEVLLDAELPHGGAYTSAASYDWREIEAIVGALAARLGVDAATVLRDYGRHLFATFAERFADLVGSAADPHELLLGIGAHIESEVAKLYDDPELPRFRVERAADGLIVDYESTRPFASLAHGLIEGCHRHFGVVAEVTASGAANRCRFHVRVAQEAS